MRVPHQPSEWQEYACNGWLTPDAALLYKTGVATARQTDVLSGSTMVGSGECDQCDGVT